MLRIINQHLCSASKQIGLTVLKRILNISLSIQENEIKSRENWERRELIRKAYTIEMLF